MSEIALPCRVIDDFMIYSAKTIIDRYADPVIGLADTSAIDSELNQFLLENRLWADVEKWTKFSDWKNFKFFKSDLTPVGFELMRICHDKWLAKIDRTGKSDMVIWATALESLTKRVVTAHPY